MSTVPTTQQMLDAVRARIYSLLSGVKSSSQPTGAAYENWDITQLREYEKELAAQLAAEQASGVDGAGAIPRCVDVTMSGAGGNRL